ncbi:MAG: alpha/beta fold hydrolase [Alphaproteobacteria bacterium]|nr:alpha/beta fold hydrolase [Alphaproteobacteria bacterium]
MPETIEAAGGEVHWVERPGGVRLRVATFGDPNAGNGWCTVLPGYTEFIEKFLETVQDLRARDYAVMLHDWRGQGLSSRLLKDRHKGHLDSFKTHRDDLLAIWDAFGLGSRVPTIFAHSMGGHVALLAEAARPGLIGRAVMLAPMMGIAPPGMPVGVARGLTSGFCALGLSETYVFGGAGYETGGRPFEGNRLTNDRGRYDRFHRLIAANPDLAIGDPTLGWVRAAFRSLAVTDQLGWLERIATPLLMISAGQEKIVSNAALEAASARLQNAESVRVAAARHDLMSETDATRAEIWAAIDRFLDRTGA